jgi:DNA mismatch endonuclease (patch repair protein)
VKLPKTRKEFWAMKIARTKERDKENVDSLHYLGWRGMVVWECELKHPAELVRRLEREIRV